MYHFFVRTNSEFIRADIDTFTDGTLSREDKKHCKTQYKINIFHIHTIELQLASGEPPASALYIYYNIYIHYHILILSYTYIICLFFWEWASCPRVSHSVWSRRFSLRFTSAKTSKSTNQNLPTWSGGVGKTMHGLWSPWCLENVVGSVGSSLRLFGLIAYDSAHEIPGSVDCWSWKSGNMGDIQNAAEVCLLSTSASGPESGLQIKAARDYSAAPFSERRWWAVSRDTKWYQGKVGCLCATGQTSFPERCPGAWQG